MAPVDELFVAAGSPVTAGDKIYDIRVETITDPAPTADALGQVTMTQPTPVITFSKVLAPATGVLSSLTVIHGQAVAVGDATGQVAPPSFSVSGSLSPDQQYRLQTRPTEAFVTITNGPAPFTCTGLVVSTPLAGAAARRRPAGAPRGPTGA